MQIVLGFIAARSWYSPSEMRIRGPQGDCGKRIEVIDDMILHLTGNAEKNAIVSHVVDPAMYSLMRCGEGGVAVQKADKITSGDLHHAKTHGVRRGCQITCGLPRHLASYFAFWWCEEAKTIEMTTQCRKRRKMFRPVVRRASTDFSMSQCQVQASLKILV